MRRAGTRGCGRTRAARLAALDRVLVHCERELLARDDGAFGSAVCVDVGVGESPWTTLEYAQAVQLVRSDLRVIGVENDPERLAHATAFGGPRLEYRGSSGFELPLTTEEPARLVRAMNLLRSYREQEVPEAHRALATPLLPGGLLIEGSSSSDGGVACAHWLRKRSDRLTREALLFATDYTHGFSPWLFRDWLPRDLRRHTRPPEPLFEFFRSWSGAFEAARSTGLCEASALFVHSALILSTRVAGIVLDSFLLSQGCLFWKPLGGIPSACRTLEAPA